MNDRIQEIFDQALKQDSLPRRQKYLEDACGGDRALRQEVESLLAAHFHAGAFLQPPVAASAAQKTMALPTLSETTGTRIGRYKLLERIGEGGFGVVWMAEQEEPVRRRVALKIIKLGMDTKEVVARFEAERQALALMDHPNIARVFDGGATDTGRPYFVMELVKGIPITDYCDTNKLSTAQRLALFMQVCHAVQHAHQKGVIHRDLKPSNILVTVIDDQPVPKVIDFGVAKATQSRLTEKTMFTQFRQLIGTPAYMSPEQAGLGSLDVDTRSDVYSLGVLLYELLTGRTPFDTAKLLEKGYDAVLRTIREEEPPKPSTRLSTLNREELLAVAAKRGAEPAKLNRLVHGDLDWMVMKALEKDRKRRYETPNALAADIQRYQNCEAVSAAAPTLGYQVLKFSRRHRAALGVAAILITLLVAGTTLSTWQALRASRLAQAELKQRELAEGLAKQSEAHYQSARLNLYAADMALAHEALQKGNPTRARQLLTGYFPKASQKDLRGLEWRYLWALAQGDQIATLQVPTHATGWVDALAVSPGNRWLASGTSDGIITVWDQARFEPVRTYPGHTNKCTDLCFSPNGQVLASCSWEANQLRLWEVSSGKLLRDVALSRPYRIVFSPDGALLAAATQDETEGVTVLCNGATGEVLGELPESGGRAVAFSRDGKSLATGAWHQNIRVWDVATRELRQSFQGRNLGYCRYMGFAPDASRLAASDWSDLLVWNVTNGTYSGSLTNGPWDLGRIVFSPDGTKVACGTGYGVVSLWDAASLKPIRYLHGHSKFVTGLAFSADGRLLFSGGADHTIRIWRTDEKSPQSSFCRIWAERAWNMPQWPCSADGLHLAVRSGNSIHVLNSVAGRCESHFPSTAFPLGFSSDGQTLVCLNGAWDLGVSDLVIRKETPRPADASTQGAIELWDWQEKTNRRVSLSRLPMDTCRSVAISPQRDVLAFNLASGLPDKGRRIVFVGITHGEVHPASLTVDGYGDGPLEFSPDGRRLLVNGAKRCWLWEWQTTHAPEILPEAICQITRAAFSADGKRLAVSGSPGVTVWDLASQTFLGEVPFGFGRAGYLSFSADANTLAVGYGLGGNSKLWHVPSQRELVTMEAGRAMEFSAGDRMMAMIAIEGVYFTHLPTLAEIDSPTPPTPGDIAIQVARELERTDGHNPSAKQWKQ